LNGSEPGEVEPQEAPEVEII
jgi:hypothetical protein